VKSKIMINQLFTNVQLEIIKTFNVDLPENELIEFKNMLADYFAQRAIAGANKVWDEKGWTSEDVDRMLNAKMRSLNHN